jgi:LysM repeat protein
MKNRALLILIIVSSAILFTACERSASTAPAEIEPTQPIVIPTPTSNPAQLLIAQTQTVLAATRPTKAPTVTKAPDKPTDGPSQTEAVGSLVVTITATSEFSPTPTVLMIPTLARPASYTLQAHEDPYCVARRYNLDIGELLSNNRLTMESKPEAGTVLRIPTSNHPWTSGSRALVQHPALYTVRAGETIYQIACAYGDVSPEAIAALNGLAEPYNLTAGQILEIP